MPTLTLTFTQPLNVSVQIGDTACYVPTVTSGEFTVDDGTANNIKEIGIIKQITPWNGTQAVIVCDTTLPGTLDGTSQYIFFYKDNRVNLSSILGYYSEITLENDSSILSELHSVACDVFESSK